MDDVDSPPNLPLGSADLNKRPDHPPAWPHSCDSAPSGRRTRYGVGTLPQDARRLSHAVPFLRQGPPNSSDKACTQHQSPPDLRTDYDTRPHRDLHELRKQRGFARKDSKASLCARLHRTDEVDSAHGMSAKRSRAQQDVVDSRELVMTGRQPDKRRRQADAFLNFATNQEILTRYA